MRHSFDAINTVTFFGSGTALTRIVKDLLGKKQVRVVTGKRLLETPSHDGRTLQAFLEAHRVPLEVYEDINTDGKIQASLDSKTLGISLGAPWIFRQPLINAFRGKLINGHSAPLPRERGGGGDSWRIMRRDRRGACILHLVTSQIDAGPIVKVHRYRFPASCKIPKEFAAYAATKMYRLLRELLGEIERGVTFDLRPQAEHTSSYWPRLNTKVHGYLDWSWPLEDLAAFIDAFDEPYGGASTFLNGQRVHLRKARVDTSDERFHPFQAGLVYRKTKDDLWVAAHEGSLVVSEVLTQLGKPILQRVTLGDRFYTPWRYLEAARCARVFYTATGFVVQGHARRTHLRRVPVGAR